MSHFTKKLRGTCAVCGEHECDTEFWDPALREFDVAHKGCLGQKTDREMRELLFASAPREEQY